MRKHTPKNQLEYRWKNERKRRRTGWKSDRASGRISGTYTGDLGHWPGIE